MAKRLNYRYGDRGVGACDIDLHTIEKDNGVGGKEREEIHESAPESVTLPLKSHFHSSTFSPLLSLSLSLTRPRSAAVSRFSIFPDWEQPLALPFKGAPDREGTFH